MRASGRAPVGEGADSEFASSGDLPPRSPTELAQPNPKSLLQYSLPARLRQRRKGGEPISDAPSPTSAAVPPGTGEQLQAPGAARSSHFP